MALNPTLSVVAVYQNRRRQQRKGTIMAGSRAAFDSLRARRLYDEGTPDTKIADALGVWRSVVRRWRAREGLPALFRQGCSNGRAVSPETRERATQLLARGISSRDVALRTGIGDATARRIRKAMGDHPGLLPSGGQRKPSFATPFKDEAYARIARAVSRFLPADIRDDVISDAYVALLEGTLAEADIETRIRRFENRVIGSFANKFGALSLDEGRGEDGTFSLMQTIADPSAAVAFDLALYRGFEARGAI
jgi:transposase-like protein